MNVESNQEPRLGNFVTGPRFEIRICRKSSRVAVKSTKDREVENHSRHAGISGSSALCLSMKVKSPKNGQLIDPGFMLS
jgi:hypothetical protein